MPCDRQGMEVIFIDKPDGNLKIMCSDLYRSPMRYVIVIHGIYMRPLLLNMKMKRKG